MDENVESSLERMAVYFVYKKQSEYSWPRVQTMFVIIISLFTLTSLILDSMCVYMFINIYVCVCVYMYPYLLSCYLLLLLWDELHPQLITHWSSHLR